MWRRIGLAKAMSTCLFGVEPVSLMGNVWNVTLGRPDAILQTDGIIVDDCEREKLEFPELGDQRELGGKRARIVGMSHGVMGFLVAETLYALVLDRLGEFGTLKAIGATERQMFSILIMQALIMATVGAVLGLSCVAGIQYMCSEPRAPIVIPWWLSLGSCVLVSAICLVSSLLPYLRIRKIDPMMVLQS